MSQDLTLTGAIPGLLRRGSPVNVHINGHSTPGVYTQPDDRDPSARVGPHTIAPLDEWPDDYDASAAMARSCADDELTLDLTDPTGRFHAILWLRERGHDLRWAEEEPEVLAWSVLSVARGGRPIVATLSAWTGSTGFKREVRSGFIGEIRVESHVGEECYYGRHNYRKGWRLFGEHTGTIAAGSDTGAVGRAAADRAAIAAGYALRNDDGTITLPPLPEAK